VVARDGDQATHDRLGLLAHEMRNHLYVATLALTAIRSGTVGITGSTGAALDRCLIGMRHLVDRSLADVRVTAGRFAHHPLIGLNDLITEARVTGTLEAHARGCVFTVTPIDPTLAIYADRDLLLSAIGNVLQNAFKFTHPGTEVTLTAHAAADRVLIDTEDHCGGIGAEKMATMFLPVPRNSANPSSAGLSLSISQRIVEANNGSLRVRDVPGSGCVFTIDLPRHLLQ
jgi:signal transduction histidine kinase